MYTAPRVPVLPPSRWCVHLGAQISADDHPPIILPLRERLRIALVRACVAVAFRLLRRQQRAKADAPAEAPAHAPFRAGLRARGGLLDRRWGLAMLRRILLVRPRLIGAPPSVGARAAAAAEARAPQRRRGARRVEPCRRRERGARALARAGAASTGASVAGAASRVSHAVAVWLTRQPARLREGRARRLHLPRPVASTAPTSPPTRQPGHCHVIACRPTIHAVMPARGAPCAIGARHARHVERPVLAFSTVRNEAAPLAATAAVGTTVGTVAGDLAFLAATMRRGSGMESSSSNSDTSSSSSSASS